MNVLYCKSFPWVHAKYAAIAKSKKIYMYYSSKTIGAMLSVFHLPDVIKCELKNTNEKEVATAFFAAFLISVNTIKKTNMYFSSVCLCKMLEAVLVFCLMRHINKTIVYCCSFILFDKFFLALVVDFNHKAK